MIHPNAIDLEAFAAGEPSPRVASHVEACDACRGFIARAQSLPMRVPVETLIDDARRMEKRRRVVVFFSAGVGLAAAAALMLVMRSPALSPTSSPASSPASNVATNPPVASSVAEASAPATLAQRDPDTTFKGGVQLAVVRERDGRQDRFVATVHVKPGDRLRVEVALDRSQAILGGVLGEDGTWVELMPEYVRDAGTHFSEKSVRVDDHRANGMIVIGAPEAVRRTRITNMPDGVRVLRIEWEGP